MTAISLQHVSKTYQLWGKRSQFATLKSALLRRELKPSPEASVQALRDVSFTVARGEAFGIIGRNGSGKSTLLKLISGILKPTSGRVQVTGRIAALIELGAGFHPEITGRENIFINGIMLGLTRRDIENRFEKIVEFSGIRDFIDQPVKTYSSGMYVRLGFAVAVHVDPDILLIDEVLSVGDEEFSAKCIAKIQEMKQRGVTLVFVTHQLDQVKNLCDRAVWIDHGVVAAAGDPMRCVDAYLQQVATGERVKVAHVELVEPAEEETAVDDEAEDTDVIEEERWGSGELVLKRVALTDPSGNELVALGGGTPVTIDVDVEVREAQDDVVFGVGIYHADGTCVYGTNTDLEGFVPERIERDGRMRFVMPSLDLVAGSYRLDLAIHTRNGRAFDYRRGAVRFIVGSRVHDIGVYRPEHEWKFDGGLTFRSGDVRHNLPAPIAEALRESERPPEPPAPKLPPARKPRK